MSLVRAIAKNVTAQITGRVIGTILGLVTIALITHYLGTFGFGEYTTATSYLQFIGVLVDFGLTLTAVQMLSEPGADEGKILGNIVSLRLLTAAIVFAAAPFIALAIGWSSTVHRSIFIGTLSFAFLSIHQMFVGLFQRRMRTELSAIAEVVGRAVLLAATVLVIAKNGGVAGIIIALVAGNAFMVAVSYFFAKKIQPFHWRLEMPVVKAIIKKSWPMAVSIVFNLVYLRGDMLVLSLTRSQSEVGLYGAAYKPLDVVTVVPMMFMGLVLPFLVQAWSTSDKVRLGHLLQRSTDAISMLAFPIAFGGLVLSTPIMVFLSGEPFAGSGPLLSMLLIAAGCVFFGSLFGHAIVAINKQRTMMWVYGADALLSLVLYILLIPRFGAVAGALVTILSELLIALGAGCIVLRTTGVRLKINTPLKAIGASILMSTTLAMLPNVHVLLRIAFGAILYGVTVVAIGAVRQDDLYAIFKRRQAN